MTKTEQAAADAADCSAAANAFGSDEAYNGTLALVLDEMTTERGAREHGLAKPLTFKQACNVRAALTR